MKTLRMAVLDAVSAGKLQRLTVAALCAGVLAACGGAKEAGPSQVAARVDKSEITVHQISGAMSGQQVKGELVPRVERQVLERLIDRELAVQKAADLKLDRDPRVVQAIESARKEIIAKAYADKLGEGAARPSAADIKKYYDDNPTLFRERKVYQLQEFAIQADAAQVDSLKAALASIKSGDELAAHLKGTGLKFTANQSVRAAEQLPMSLLPTLSKMNEGQALVNQNASGATILLVRGARLQPVEEDRASRAIEQFLLNEQRRKLLADDLKALRAAAKIEYQGRFAASAPVPAEATSPTPAEVAASAAAGLDAKTPAEAVPAAEAIPATPASGLDPTTVNKGLGLK